jgi:hydroxyethylthiazole kinase
MTAPHWTIEALEHIRLQNPLIHHLTNFVVMNFNANVVLALGGSPIMAHASDELEELIPHARSLVINIGTLDSTWVTAMKHAVQLAARHNVPWILDPVGAGATLYRQRTCQELMNLSLPSVIRGNGSEIGALAGLPATGHGVDSTASMHSSFEAAALLAKQMQGTIVVSGVVDGVISPNQKAYIANGCKKMSAITGMGCSATSVIATFLGASPTPWQAAVSGMLVMGVAGDIANLKDPGLGTYAVSFLDALGTLTAEDLMTRARLHETVPF